MDLEMYYGQSSPFSSDFLALFHTLISSSKDKPFITSTFTPSDVPNMVPLSKLPNLLKQLIEIDKLVKNVKDH